MAILAVLLRTRVFDDAKAEFRVAFERNMRGIFVWTPDVTAAKVVLQNQKKCSPERNYGAVRGLCLRRAEFRFLLPSWVYVLASGPFGCRRQDLSSGGDPSRLDELQIGGEPCPG